jgi:hypothetical protein
MTLQTWNLVYSTDPSSGNAALLKFKGRSCVVCILDYGPRGEMGFLSILRERKLTESQSHNSHYWHL